MLKIKVELLKEKVKKILDEEIPKLEALEGQYKVEISRAEAGTYNYSGMSEDERNSIKESLDKQKEYLSKYRSNLDNTCEEMNKLFEKREEPNLDVAARNDIDSKLNELRDEQNKIKRDFESIKQGKTADVISASLGSIDKRIHNRLYGNNNKRWEKHKANVQNRYDHPSANLKYALSRGAITALIGVSSVGAMLVNPIFGGMVIAAAVGYGSKVITNVVSTIFNRRKYGRPPEFVQKYNILEGRAANVAKARNEREIADNLMLRYQNAMANPVPTIPTNPAPAPTPASPAATNDLTNLLIRLNALTDADYNNTNADYINNTLRPLYEALRTHVADIPVPDKAKYDRLEKKIELFDIINEINALTTVEITDGNYNHINDLHGRASRRLLELPVELRGKIATIRGKLREYNDKKSELEAIKNGINNYVSQNITEGNVDAIREFLARARNHVDELPEEFKRKLNFIEGKLRNYGTRANTPDGPIIGETTSDEMDRHSEDLENYNLGMIGVSDEYRDKPLPFLDAISAVRRVNVDDAEEKDSEKKIAAYDKLYKTLGTGRSKKSTTDERKLNDYNYTLKKLAEYGRKVHSGKATPQEKNVYIGLLYHLGKEKGFTDYDFIFEIFDEEYANRVEQQERTSGRGR